MTYFIEAQSTLFSAIFTVQKPLLIHIAYKILTKCSQPQIKTNAKLLVLPINTGHKAPLNHFCVL
jgi:aspartate/glutamate racemase